MATSGTITGTKVKSLWLTFEWKRTSIGIIENLSIVQWSLNLNSSIPLTFSADKTFTLKIDGKNYGGTFTKNINWGDNGGSVVIKSGTTEITHNSNGKKTFEVSSVFNIAVAISGTQVNSLSLSGNGILNDIPRATVPTIEPSVGVRTGSTIEINLNRASDTFTHDLTYKFEDASGVIAEDVDEITNWTIPRYLANHLPNSASGMCSIICKTYEGTKLIGTTKTEFVLIVNALDIPMISSITIEETVTSIKEKFNAFIQNKSKVKVNVEADGVYSSTIKSYEVRFLGFTFYKNEFTSEEISTSGKVSFVVKVTDSRGRTAITTKTIEVLPYTSPTIELFDVKRCDSSGVENPQETFMSARIKFNVTPLNNLNDKSFKLEYQEQGASEWTTLLTGSEYTYDSTYVHSNAIFESTKSYSVRLTLSDFFKSVTYSFDVGTSFFLWFWDKTGTGLSIGDAQAIANMFSVALETRFKKKVTFDDISGIPQFTDSGWLDLPLRNGWTYQYDTDKPQYRKIGNVVYLRGLVSATQSAGTSIGDLPVGFRPSAGSFNRFACAVNQKDYVNVQVGTNGLVADYAKTTSVARTFISLSNISFFTN